VSEKRELDREIERGKAKETTEVSGRFFLDHLGDSGVK
jgi:hypothetical protein